MFFLRQFTRLMAIILCVSMNTAMAVGFYSIDKFNFIDSDNEQIASINCAHLPYETSTFLKKVSDRNSNVLIQELVVRSKSLILKFNSENSEVSEFTIDTSRLDCELQK